MPSRVTVNFRDDMFTMGKGARILDARRERLTEQRAKPMAIPSESIARDTESGSDGFSSPSAHA